MYFMFRACTIEVKHANVERTSLLSTLIMWSMKTKEVKQSNVHRRLRYFPSLEIVNKSVTRPDIYQFKGMGRNALLSLFTNVK